MMCSFCPRCSSLDLCDGITIGKLPLKCAMSPWICEDCWDEREGQDTD